MIEEFKREKVFTSFLWKFLERSSNQILQFIVSIILARLLEPSLFGSIALVMVFITILNVFVDSGFGSALIQKKNADQLDFTTVFYFNIFMCVVLYLILFICAPLIANFYNDEQLIVVIRVLGVSLPFSAFCTIQTVYISKNLLFRKLFFVNIISSFTGAAIGIYCAFNSFEIWSLVFQQITNALVSTVILWIFIGWKPSLQFSFKRLKTLFNYGWKLLAAGLIDTIYNQLNQFIIGKIYSTSDLAFYNRGNTFPSVIVSNVNSSINSVLFPTMSNVQDNVLRVRDMTRRAIKTSIYFIAPFMFGLIFTADIFIPLLLTEKWLSCIFFLRIFCFVYLFYPIHTANLSAINALGRSDLFLKLEIIKKIFGITAVFITAWISVEAMAVSLLFTSVVSQIVNAYPNKKLLNYSYSSQLKDIIPEIFLALFMGICVFWFKFLPFHYAVIVLIQVIFGVLIYYLGSKFLKLDSYFYASTLLKDLYNKKVSN